MTEKRAEESGGFMSDLTRKELLAAEPPSPPRRHRRRGRRVAPSTAADVVPPRPSASKKSTKVGLPTSTADEVRRAQAEETARPPRRLAPHGWV